MPLSVSPPSSRARLVRAGLRLATLAVALAGTPALMAAPAADPARPSDTTDAGPLRGARQLVLVSTAGWDDSQGTLYRYERSDDTTAWQPVGAFAISIGRNGSAWGSGLHADADLDRGPRKREGDGRSPAGVFALGTAFGYAPDPPRGGLPYQPMQASHWCMDVPDSPLYNRIVDARDTGADAVAGSTEPMRLDLHKNGDPRYRLGFVIDHNPVHVPQGGSCIFAHLWRSPGEPTAGCTAMADADMQALLAWLDPALAPRFVLLPEPERQRLAARWHLPQAGHSAADAAAAPAAPR